MAGTSGPLRPKRRGGGTKITGMLFARQAAIVSAQAGTVAFAPLMQRGDSGFMKPFCMSLLRRLGADTLILTGTTTPNCIRTTCYDAISLDYRVVVLEDCCSSNSEEIQQANLLDMANVGAEIWMSSEFLSG